MEDGGIRDTVLTELKAVRKRGYVRLDATRTRPTQVDTTTLVLAATRVPGYHAKLTRAAVIELLLKHAIEQLPEHFRELLITIFGLKKGLDPNKPDELRKTAAKDAGQSVETFKIDGEATALQALAEQIAVNYATSDAANDKDSKPTQPTKVPGEVLAVRVEAPSDDPLRLSPRGDVVDEELTASVIRSALPDVDDKTAYRLGISLNFDPLLAEEVCAYILSIDLSPLDACKLLACDAGVLLDSVALSRGKLPVTQTIALKVAQAGEMYPRSLEALDLLIYFQHEYIPVELIISYFLGRKHIGREELRYGALTYSRVVQPLVDNGLVEFYGVFVRMNPLVQAICRDLRKTEAQVVRNRLSAVLDHTRSPYKQTMELLRVGWSPKSIAGRWTALCAAAAHLYDRLYNGSVATKAGRLGGADWMLVTKHLMAKVLYETVFDWMMNQFSAVTAKRLSDDLDEWEKSIESFIDPIDDEVVQLADDIFKQVFPQPSQNESDADRVGEVLQEIVASFENDEVTTRLGTLRFSEYLPNWHRDQRNQMPISE